MDDMTVFARSIPQWYPQWYVEIIDMTREVVDLLELKNNVAQWRNELEHLKKYNLSINCGRDDQLTDWIELGEQQLRAANML